MIRQHTPGPWTVREETTLTEAEDRLFDSAPLRNFAHHSRYGTDATQLFFAKIYEGNDLVGLAPVTKIVKRDSRMLLREPRNRVLSAILGPFAYKTTYLVDTTMLAFQYRTPFFVRPGADLDAVRRTIADYLKARRDVDNVWISEPEAEAAWLRRERFDCFPVLPMVQVHLSGFATMDEFLKSLSKNRRNSARDAARAFERAGATVEVLHSPFPPDALKGMCNCLVGSYQRGWLHVPYGDVLNNPQAFAEQPQMALVGRIGERIIAFASFITDKDEFLQCHGGLDYELALEARAYQHLLQTAVGHAFDGGFHRACFGPLNNETKRRVGVQHMPVTAGLWTRQVIFRPVVRRLVIPKFQVYYQPAGTTNGTSGNGQH